MKLDACDRFVYARLVELKQMLRQGDYPDCRGICGFIHLHTKNMDYNNQMLIDGAINTMKDIMSNWVEASDSWEYPVRAAEEEAGAEEAEHVFIYMCEYDHWMDTEYSERRRRLLDYTINEYIEWIANESTSN